MSQFISVLFGCLVASAMVIRLEGCGNILQFEAGLLGRFFDKSAKQCQDICESRPRCKTARYIKNFAQCNIYDAVGANDQEGFPEGETRIYSKPSKVRNEQLGRCQCPDQKQCHFNKGTNEMKCKVYTCGVPDINDADYHGNRMSVGSKVMYTCKYNKSENGIITCDRHGSWSPANVTCPTYTDKICYYLKNNQWILETCDRPRQTSTNTSNQTTEELECLLKSNGRSADKWEHSSFSWPTDTDGTNETSFSCQWPGSIVRSSHVTQLHLSSVGTGSTVKVRYKCDDGMVLDRKWFEQGQITSVDVNEVHGMVQCVRKSPNTYWKHIYRQVANDKKSIINNWRNDSKGTQGHNLQRSDIIDHWKDSKIKRIKLEVIHSSSVVAEIMFNGSRTNNEDWFSKEHLISSSWTNLVSNSSFDYFSLNGTRFDKGKVARFFISQSSSGSCGEDFGWFVVTHNLYPCTNDRTKGIHILYTKENKPCYFDNAGFADRFDVSVELEG